ncbi:MAG: alpha/beta fold hydrolase [bacterium]|nr:alpha/beta fold hydrolase [bacterium]
MIKRFVIACFVLTLVLPAALFAGGDSSSICDTKYPIVLAHGMGASSNIDVFGVKVMEYWYQIDDALEDEGASVYITSVDGMDGTESKAEDWKSQLLQILAVSGASKVNIIGHSHGTIYTRYAISNLGVADKVASHTSIAGPHRGSALADVMVGTLSDEGEWLLGSVVDSIYTWLFGNKNPDSVQNTYDLTMDYMQNTFNPNTPDQSGVYYQSWGAKIKTITADLFLEPTFLLVSFYEGANDGLVSTTSAQWGNFRGIESGAWWCGGVSHVNIVNMFLGVTPGFDAPEFYVDVVSELKDMGY